MATQLAIIVTVLAMALIRVVTAPALATIRAMGNLAAVVTAVAIITLARLVPAITAARIRLGNLQVKPLLLLQVAVARPRLQVPGRYHELSVCGVLLTSDL